MPNLPPKTLDIILVTWNSTGTLLRCLESLAKSKVAGTTVKVTVIDNGSAIAPSQADFPSSLVTSVIRNERNTGFARACNAGAAEGSGKYLLFLNPDTLVSGDALLAAVDFMDSSDHWETAVVGVRTTDAKGITHKTCAYIPTFRTMLCGSLFLDRLCPQACPGFLMRDWDHLETKYVDHVIGAFFLVRRQVFAELGGFDESFFVYLEDLDFCARARRRGMKVVFLADVSIFHEQGGVSRQDIAHRMFHSEKSRIIYARKHFGRTEAALLLVLSFVIALPLRLVVAAQKRSWPEARSTLVAYSRLARSFGGLSELRSS